MCYFKLQKFKKVRWVGYSDKCVMGKSSDIKTGHEQDFATNLFQFHDFIF